MRSPNIELTQVTKAGSPQEVQGLGTDTPWPLGLKDNETGHLQRGSLGDLSVQVKPKTMLVLSITIKL